MVGMERVWGCVGRCNKDMVMVVGWEGINRFEMDSVFVIC